VFEWLEKHTQTLIRPNTKASIRFAGTVERREPFGERLNGWFVAPAVAHFQPGGTPSTWQWWRTSRGLWGPLAAMTQAAYAVRREGNSLSFEQRGEVIARWSDWTEELRERLASTLLPASGQMLLVRRDVIEQFASEHGMGFCWLARLTAFSRKHTYEAYEPIHAYRAYGTSNIIIPG